MDAPVAQAYALLLVLFRVAALAMVAPGLGARVVPARVRLGIAVVVAFVAFLGAGAPQVPMPRNWLELALAAGSETLVGIAGGIGARMVLEAANAAGQVVGLAMGLGYGGLVNPASGADSTSVGQLYANLALGLAMAFGVHREALMWICRSLREVPPGQVADFATLGQHAIGQLIFSTALAVRVAFPVLAAILAGQGVMGVLGRVAPQLNVQSVGFSVTLLAGGAAVYFCVPVAAELVARAALGSFPGS